MQVQVMLSYKRFVLYSKSNLPEGPALPPVVVVVVEDAAEMDDEAAMAADPLVAA